MITSTLRPNRDDVLPNSGCKSRHGDPVRSTHRTASTKRRLSSPDRPASPVLPGTKSSIRRHCRSVSSRRIKIASTICDLESHSRVRWNPECQQDLGCPFSAKKAHPGISKCSMLSASISFAVASSDPTTVVHARRRVVRLQSDPGSVQNKLATRKRGFAIPRIVTFCGLSR